MTETTAVSQTVAVDLIWGLFTTGSHSKEFDDWIDSGFRKWIVTRRPIEKCLGIGAPSPGYDDAGEVFIKRAFNEQVVKLHCLCGKPYFGSTKLLAPMMGVLQQLKSLVDTGLAEGLTDAQVAEAIIPPPSVTDNEGFYNCIKSSYALLCTKVPRIPSQRKIRQVLLGKIADKEAFTRPKTALSSTVKNKKPPEFADGKDRPKLRIIGTK